MIGRALAEIQTPALLLCEGKLDRNIARMKARMNGFGVPLRPHIKTAKSYEVYARALEGAVGVTVSTLAEAEYAVENGVSNILYAVGIAPGKLDRALALRAKGADLTLIVDTVEAAQAVAAKGERAQDRIPVLIEIDSDDHRAGVKPLSGAARAIAGFLNSAKGARYRGLMTHAGGSYDCRSIDAIRAVAEKERRAVVDTATVLAADGIKSEIVSVGSTPTATFGGSFDGVTEVRVGVYMFQDLVMAGLGVCAVADIALSVLVSVIGHQAERSWIITDGGWMAMSRDRGTSAFPVDQGYGIVCDAAGRPVGDLIVTSCNQEHGIVVRRNGGAINLADFPVGRLLRILPNHACATAAQFDAYHMIDAHQRVTSSVPRLNGW
jgi:D-serine deaminase-like pyridoxal phosphate-dependent protein